ncbi:hypothetical protein Gohar_002502 [Gossypium harknessii]|uniref:Uncharacterized protein n=1 Tax=Gossypium harknessii TaxID=34285 RepID=A0A7J9HKZ6_9ROSI|nr:hypothetical protein [Gossypium harknessii]
MKRFFANPMLTQEYDWWWEIIKQDFRKKSSELGKRIEKLEEEKIQLGLDVDIQTLEAKKIRKGKNKA